MKRKRITAKYFFITTPVKIVDKGCVHNAVRLVNSFYRIFRITGQLDENNAMQYTHVDGFKVFDGVDHCRIFGGVFEWLIC